MNAVNIALKVFELPYALNESKLRNWKSELFRISDIQHHEITEDCDLETWGYSDATASRMLECEVEADITIGLINAPLEDNYYMRRLSDNRALISLSEPGLFLQAEHIDFENFILRNLYEAVLAYKAYKSRLPSDDRIEMLHEATRGCLFDLSGSIADVVYSSASPSLCESCASILRRRGISTDLIHDVKKELRKLRQQAYYRWRTRIQAHPYISLILSVLVAFVVNLLAAFVFSWLTTSR